MKGFAKTVFIGSGAQEIYRARKSFQEIAAERKKRKAREMAEDGSVRSSKSIFFDACHLLMRECFNEYWTSRRNQERVKNDIKWISSLRQGGDIKHVERMLNDPGSVLSVFKSRFPNVFLRVVEEGEHSLRTVKRDFKSLGQTLCWVLHACFKEFSRKEIPRRKFPREAISKNCQIYALHSLGPFIVDLMKRNDRRSDEKERKMGRFRLFFFLERLPLKARTLELMKCPQPYKEAILKLGEVAESGDWFLHCEILEEVYELVLHQIDSYAPGSTQRKIHDTDLSLLLFYVLINADVHKIATWFDYMKYISSGEPKNDVFELFYSVMQWALGGDVCVRTARDEAKAFEEKIRKEESERMQQRMQHETKEYDSVKDSLLGRLGFSTSPHLDLDHSGGDQKNKKKVLGRRGANIGLRAIGNQIERSKSCLEGELSSVQQFTPPPSGGFHSKNVKSFASRGRSGRRGRSIQKKVVPPPVPPDLRSKSRRGRVPGSLPVARPPRGRPPVGRGRSGRRRRPPGGKTGVGGRKSPPSAALNISMQEKLHQRTSTADDFGDILGDVMGKLNEGADYESEMKQNTNPVYDAREEEDDDDDSDDDGLFNKMKSEVSQKKVMKPSPSRNAKPASRRRRNFQSHNNRQGVKQQEDDDDSDDELFSKMKAMAQKSGGGSKKEHARAVSYRQEPAVVAQRTVEEDEDSSDEEESLFNQMKTEIGKKRSQEGNSGGRKRPKPKPESQAGRQARPKPKPKPKPEFQAGRQARPIRSPPPPIEKDGDGGSDSDENLFMKMRSSIRKRSDGGFSGGSSNSSSRKTSGGVTAGGRAAGGRRKKGVDLKKIGRRISKKMLPLSNERNPFNQQQQQNKGRRAQDQNKNQDQAANTSASSEEIELLCGKVAKLESRIAQLSDENGLLVRENKKLGSDKKFMVEENRKLLHENAKLTERVKKKSKSGGGVGLEAQQEWSRKEAEMMERIEKMEKKMKNRKMVYDLKSEQMMDIINKLKKDKRKLKMKLAKYS